MLAIRVRCNVNDHAWIALQAAEQLRAAERLLLPAVAITASLDPEGARDAEVLIAAEDMAELKMITAELMEFCGQIVGLSERLPDTNLRVSYSDLVVAAADDLANGIMDPIRARLAARVLPIAVGWPALVEALRSTDAHAAWDDLTVGEMLTAFHDAEPPLSNRVLAAAELSSSDRFCSCDTNGLRRLAAALAEHAPTQ